MRTFVLGLAAASLFTLSTLGATPSVEISTSFATDPAQQGWKTFGNSNLFNWNSTNGCLDVTWDSSKSNSYFYLPIGTVLTRKDDFAMEFDLTINDISTSFDQMALGFLNLGDATNSEFSRVTGSNSLNLAEFDYFHTADYGSDVYAEFSATNLLKNGLSLEVDWGAPQILLPLGKPLHVVQSYTGSTSTIVTTISNNGNTLYSRPFTISASFTDFRCDAFAIESYNDPKPYNGAILRAHGSVRNVKLTVPVPPVRNIKGQLQPTGWTVTFDSLVDWNYALERSSDLVTWTDVTTNIDRTEATCTLQDRDAVTGARFYRVRAQRPN